VLTEFSQRIGGGYQAEDVLPRMARLIVDGTGATRADVWFRTDAVWSLETSWPADAAPVASPESDGGRVFEVRHDGQLLGALSLVKPSADPVTPGEEQLVGALASQAGLVLRNARLTDALRAKVDDLRDSRRRLVATQDQERRRLERDIHDGAQQHLVSLMVRLRLAEGLMEKSPEKAAKALADAKDQAGEALDTLRDLARGIYPPLLADQGLPAALSAAAGKSTVAVEVHPDGVGRYPQDIEAAVYFCVLEALQNVAKYAGATRADLTLRRVEHGLEFEVRDDGSGFDPATTPKGSGLQNMEDRLAALGGSLEVRSTPGEGASIVGRVPGEGIT
jgi:signal transduction histidine kinase